MIITCLDINDSSFKRCYFCIRRETLMDENGVELDWKSYCSTNVNYRFLNSCTTLKDWNTFLNYYVGSSIYDSRDIRCMELLIKQYFPEHIETFNKIVLLK